MKVDVMIDGRAIITDPNGRKAILTADQWAFIQAQRIEIAAAKGKRIELFWYMQALAYHILTQNATSSRKKSLR